ncbi:hypothetical protein C8F01DRAFT_5932 [Mycena amicta]|nr:hypothetical protein C8F01DRAFT_5932 [Mycena amicta]
MSAASHLRRRLYASDRELEQRATRTTKFYPVLTLPNEIVSEIFKQCLPVYPVCPPLLGRGSPTLLGQICRHWREIALSTPTLWRAISLFTTPPRVDPELHPIHCELAAAETFLKRSRSCLLSFMMCGNQYIRAYQQQHALSSLLEHRGRLEYVTLYLVDRKFEVHENLVDGELTLPSLLAIDSFSHKTDLDAVFLLNTPALRTAFLDLHTSVHRQLLPRLPLAQLTRLELRNIGAVHVTEVLKQTVNLVHCRLELLYNQHFDEPALGYTICLPRLEMLILGAATDVYLRFGPCLDALRLPRLRQFCIDERIITGTSDTEWTTIYPLPMLSRYIECFGCVLGTICIRDPSEVTQEEYKAGLSDIAGHVDFAYASPFPGRDNIPPRGIGVCGMYTEEKLSKRV